MSNLEILDSIFKKRESKLFNGKLKKILNFANKLRESGLIVRIRHNMGFHVLEKENGEEKKLFKFTIEYIGEEPVLCILNDYT